MDTARAMTREVVCIAPADDLDAAWQLMLDHGIRHLPVLDQDTLVGVLSDRDILLLARVEEGEVVVPGIPVAHAMSPAPVTCHSRSHVAQAAALMLEHKIDCLPVVDDEDRMVGFITSSDLLELVSRDPAAREFPYSFRLRAAWPGRAR